MWYRTLKVYQWIAIGLAVGLLVGVSRSMSSEEPTLGGPGFISQGLFVRAVETPAIDGKPYVRNVAVRPSTVVDHVDVVSLEALDTESGSYRPFLFAAPRPFAINGVAPGTKYSVWDYLRTTSASNPAVAPHAAWWEQTPATLGFYALLGVVLIGGAWPGLLTLTAAAVEVEPEYDLDRFKHEATVGNPATSSVDSDADPEDFEAAIGQGLGATPSEEVAAPVAPVRPLEDGPYIPAVAPADGDKKDFAGEFYPVEKHAPHGFSLVELVIVIGIIALLFSFLMPSLRLARLAAQQVKCADNLRSIGQALHNYASANRGWLPAWSDWHTWPPGGPSDNDGPAWTVEMIPYLGEPTSPVYNCPSFPRPDHYRNYFLESQWSGRSGRNAMKLTDIKLGGMFILSGDKTNMGLYPSVERDDTDPDDFGGAGALLWPWNGGFYMHRTGNNVLFDDGHVVLCSKFDPSSMTFNPHRIEDHDQVTPD